jgi:hypothetical protein
MRWRDPTAPATVAGHETTSRHLGALYPLLHDVGHGVPGVVIGTDLLGGLFSYDPFVLYGAGALTNPNAVVFGQIGRGKSSLVKTYVLRQLAFGRRAFVLDPKGEYSALAASVGANTLALEPGGALRLNPLDLSAGEPDGRSRRLQLLEALLASSLARPLVPRERAAVEVALDATGDAPTIPGVAAALLSPGAAAATSLHSTVAELVEDGRDVGLELRRLVHGDLAGMFDGPTTAGLALDGALVVLDLSALYASPALGVLMVCATAWLQSIVASSAAAGRQVLLVVDEAWAILRDLAVARWLQTSWKLSRAWGVANMAVLHRVSDLAAVGAAGSEQRQLAEGLLLDSETRVIYAQPPGELAAAAELLDLTPIEAEVVGRLGRGVALWKVGGHASLVRHLLGPVERRLVDTDAAMGLR